MQQKKVNKTRFNSPNWAKHYKRKEYLQKNQFFRHSDYQGIKCLFCQKNIQYFESNQRYVKLNMN